MGECRMNNLRNGDLSHNFSSNLEPTSPEDDRNQSLLLRGRQLWDKNLSNRNSIRNFRRCLQFNKKAVHPVERSPERLRYDSPPDTLSYCMLDCANSRNEDEKILSSAAESRLSDVSCVSDLILSDRKRKKFSPEETIPANNGFLPYLSPPRTTRVAEDTNIRQDGDLTDLRLGRCSGRCDPVPPMPSLTVSPSALSVQRGLCAHIPHWQLPLQDLTRLAVLPINYDSSVASTPSTAPPSITGSRVHLSRDYMQQDTTMTGLPASGCGWFCMRPRCLQHGRSSRWLLFWLCWAAAVQGMVVNGFVNVCITTIEKRYDLRSRDTGMVAGAYDLASVLCSVPVAYLGSRRGASKSRWLAAGMVIMGLGSFVFALPHFFTPAYHVTLGNSVGANMSTITCSLQAIIGETCEMSRDIWLAKFRQVFIFGQVLHGIGATPLYTLGVTYLDESVPVRMSSLYLGIYYAMAVVGPAIGYVMGGQFLNIYIDAPHTDPSSLGLSTESDRWLGGWWMGFLLSGCASMLVAWPLLGFPAVLSDHEDRTEIPKASSKRERQDSTTSATVAAFKDLGDFPSATRALMSNVTFVALSLAGAMEGILLTGFATFIPKFIESQFNVAASFSALVVGFIAVPAGGGGTMLGGWLIKKYELSCLGILRVLFTGSLFCLLSCLGLLVYCPNHEFAGVDVHYKSKVIFSPAPDGVPDLSATCNSACGCQHVSYNPVCGSDNLIYYSPCHAGCSQRHEFGAKEIFSNCSCISVKNPHSPVLFRLPEEVPPELLSGGLVLRDACTSSCFMMPYFLLMFLIQMMLTFTISLPALSGTLRCVMEEQRSLALGVQWIIVRLLGTIPGPILFGSIIDYTCRLWQKSCDTQGSCIRYDNFYMSRYMLGISFTAKGISTIMFLIAWCFYRPPRGQFSDSRDNPLPSPSTSMHPLSPRGREGAEASHMSYDNPAVEIT
ncbi:Organic anion transporter polypeptide OATP [Trinorchestia longiramus]|nr:Organic anion transporter polypeptide OATP [Trinorchestia longiramus]